MNMRAIVAVLFTLLIALPLAAATAPGEHALSIEVVLADKMLYLYDGAKVIRDFPVAIGTDDYPTPEGEYTIRELIWNPGWSPLADREWTRDATAKDPRDPENPMRVIKIPFDPPWYYIHGTSDPQTVGDEASHGCVRLRPRDAAELGKLLMSLEGENREASWYRTVLRGDRSEVVRLARPIPLRIRMGAVNVYPGLVWDVQK